MFRILFSIAAAALLLVPISANEPPAKEKLTVDLFGDIKDESLQREAPANGVIVSQKGYDKLIKAWEIKDAPKVNFDKELLVVGTWKGSSFNLNTMVKDGDLTVSGFGTKDLREGFRWRIQSMSREGIKTVQGKDLPKE